MIKPLISNIKFDKGNNQFEVSDFLSSLTAEEKIIKISSEINALYPLIKIFKYMPTHKPKNFNEQFAIYNNKLYAYINGTWALLN